MQASQHVVQLVGWFGWTSGRSLSLRLDLMEMEDQNGVIIPFRYTRGRQIVPFVKWPNNAIVGVGVMTIVPLCSLKIFLRFTFSTLSSFW